MQRLLLFIIVSAVSALTGIAGSKEPADFMGIYNAYKELPSEQLAGIGRRCLNRNETDTAMAVFTMLANRGDGNLKPEERQYISEALNSLGIISFMRGNYADAYSKFYSSTEYIDSIHSPAYLNLAGIYWLYGDYARAYDALKTEIAKAMKGGNIIHAGIAVVNLANVFPARNLPEKREEIKEMLRTYLAKVAGTRCDSSKASEIRYQSLMARALLNSLDGQHGKAAEIYREAVSNVGDMLIPDRERFSVILLRGNEFRYMGMPDSALACYHQAENIAAGGKYRELSMEVYKEMSATYAALGNDELALEYKYRHLELNDSVYNLRDFNKIRDLEASHQAQKFQSQLDIIKERHALRTRTLRIVSVAGAALAALLLYVMFQNRVLRRKNQDLFDMNLEVMEQSRAAEAAPHSVSAAPAVAAGDGAVTQKYAGASLTDDRKRQLETDIQRVMADETNFCREGFTLDTLAELCGTNTKYVSQVLNEKMGKTFPQYLNELRVDVARRRMVDFEHYGHLTLEAIVAGVGFKSRSTFSKTFKSLTGLTPSEFQKMARERGA